MKIAVIEPISIPIKDYRQAIPQHQIVDIDSRG